MHPFNDRPARRPALGVLVTLALLALAAVVSPAAVQPRVDNPHGKFKENCQLCHSAQSWKTVKVSPKFDHAKYGFPLTGAHATAACMGCHKSLDFAQQKTQCASCHQDPHRGEMGTDCAHCHGARSFQDRGPMVRAHQLSRFPLTGSHASLDCESCHKPAAQGQLQFVGTSADCYSCHKAQYDATTAPAHAAGGFSTQCQGCHTPVSWAGASFDHAGAGFPLIGLHSTNVRQCDDCHKGNYTSTSKDCYSCHQNSSPGYATATPTHDLTNFPPANCAACHSQAAATFTSWAGASANGFDHAAAGFPLTGLHSTAVRQCDDCHKGVYAGTSKDCASCHTNSSPGYASATPAHNATYFPPAQCSTCHASAAASFTSWTGGTYTHTTMQLIGLHAGRACDDCHKGNYTSVTMACSGCHTTSTPGYNTATPAHNATYFPPAQCTTCHSSAAANYASWVGGTYTHSQMQLTNAHAGRQCDDCHKGNYVSVAFSCYGCHQNPIGGTPGYATATSAVHTPTYFPTDNASCQNCHGTTVFAPSVWPLNHSTTAFAAYYNGSHPAVACNQCHNSGTWATLGTSNNCIGCHQTDWNNTASISGVPPHDPVNFPQAGCACHNTTTWLNATNFDHSTVGFSMTGLHALTARQCSDCHGIIGYTAAATNLDCITCHAAAYNSNGVMQHLSTFFPSTTTACVTCHAAANTNHLTWQGGVFTAHTPTASTIPLTGHHAGFQCSDCHTAAATNLTVFTCSVSCHASDPKFGPGGANHQQSSSFTAAAKVETIVQCYSCHKSGSAG